MCPVFFSIGPLHIYGYGCMIVVGIIAALFVAEKRAPKLGLDPDVILNLTLLAVVTGLLGAKILFCIVEFPAFVADPLGVLLSGNGFVVYGGLIGGILAGIFYCRAKGHDFLRYFDIVMPSIAIAQGFGRIGCLMAGCCYGQETDLPIGITFHVSELAPNGVKLFPTQIISSLGDFLIAIILIMAAKKIKQKGNVGILYLALYCVGRFGIEFFRADFRGSVGPFSTSQLISICVAVIATVAFIWNMKRSRETGSV